MSDIIFDPILPPWALITLGLAILGLGLYGFIHKGRAWGWRLLAALILIGGISSPKIIQQTRVAQKDIALVLVDKSTSQQLGNRADLTRQAIDHLQNSTQSFNDLELRFIDIPKSDQEEKSGTQAIGILKQTLSGIDPKRFGGAIIITDGQIHDVEQAGELPGPIHILINGRKKDIDRRIELIDAPRYAIVGKPVLIRAKVLDNAKISKQAELFLQFEDGSKQRFTPDENGIQETVYIADHAGQRVLLLDTPQIKDEISTTNNKLALSINGVRDRLRVLLVSGQPHQGQRTWRNILRSDPAVDLVHFTILRPSEKEDYTPLSELSLIAFPVRELFEEKLDDFDLIIFDRYYKHDVLNNSYFENITRYVENGGAVLISAGPDFSSSRSIAHSPLGKLLPVQPTGHISQDSPFALQMTAEGKRHPVSNRLEGPSKNWGRWMRLIEVEQQSGQTILASQDKRPVLVVDHVQKGRIAVLLSDHIWLWARGFDGGGPHAGLVRNLVHWLMKEPELEENSLRLHQIDETTIEIERQLLSGDKARVTFTSPDGTQEEIPLSAQGKGLFSKRVEAPENGLYRATDGDLHTSLVKGSLNPKELIDPRASEIPLSAVVQQTGGGFHWLEDGLPSLKRVSKQGTPAGKDWIGLVQNRYENITGSKRIDLLPPWAVFLATAFFLCLSWWRESR